MKSYCSSFYGMELWLYDEFYLRRLNCLAIAYHKAIKKIVNLAPWDSNHTACELANMQIFKHLVNSRILSFLLSILKIKSPCLNDLKYFLQFDSCILNRVSTIFRTQYNVHNILDNDPQALFSRINFMQRFEERSNYIPF